MVEGKQLLYTVNCAICHGDKGDGQWIILVQINKFPPPPSYLSEPLLSLPEGQRYHTLMYGKRYDGFLCNSTRSQRKMVGIKLCKDHYRTQTNQ
jgi:hypothetical protein